MRAVVKAPVCPLMTQPRQDCELADEALFGMVLEVLERTTPGYWWVRTPYRYEGYAPAGCLLPGDGEAEDWEVLPKRVVLHKNACDVMAAPRVQSWPLVTLPMGAVVAVTQPAETDPETGGLNGWQKAALPGGGEGYVRSSWLDVDYETPIGLPEEELRRRLVDTALLYRRSQYRWGGKTPWGIDCSGLVFMAYWLNGITVYRDARIQPGFDLVEIPPEELKPGDAIFFTGHVALYMGQGRYLHATGRAGSDGFDINSLDPAQPDYREDLARSVRQVGSYRGFHAPRFKGR